MDWKHSREKPLFNPLPLFFQVKNSIRPPLKKKIDRHMRRTTDARRAPQLILSGPRRARYRAAVCSKDLNAEHQWRGAGGAVCSSGCGLVGGQCRHAGGAVCSRGRGSSGSSDRDLAIRRHRSDCQCRAKRERHLQPHATSQLLFAAMVVMITLALLLGQCSARKYRGACFGPVGASDHDDVYIYVTAKASTMTHSCFNADKQGSVEVICESGACTPGTVFFANPPDFSGITARGKTFRFAATGQDSCVLPPAYDSKTQTWAYGPLDVVANGNYKAIIWQFCGSNAAAKTITFTVKAGTCAAGKFKSGGACVDCPVGRFRTTENAASVNDCTPCGVGKYGSGSAGETSESHCSDCPPGRYGDSQALDSSECSGACAAGRWGSIGQYASTCSGPCTAGRYGTLSQTIQTCSGDCAAGYFCKSGSDDPEQNACGSEQFYCPSGSIAPVPTPEGSYSIGGTSKMTRSGIATCETGYFCTAGVRQDCPAGRFGNEYGAATAECSGICSAGYFCAARSTSPSSGPCGTDQLAQPHADEYTGGASAYYCPKGAVNPVPVSVDHYTVPETSSPSNRQGQLACPAGGEYVCKNGIKYPIVEWSSGGCTVDSSTGSVTGVVNIPELLAGASSTGSAIKIVGHADKSTDVSSFDGLRVSSGSVTCVSAGVSCSAASKPAGCASTAAGMDAEFALDLQEFTDGSGFRLKSAVPLSFKICKEYQLTLAPHKSSKTFGPSCRLNVKVTNMNDPPSFLSGTLTARRWVEERSKLNAGVSGDRIAATDPDVGQELSFELMDDANGNFRIGTCTGELFVAKDGQLDFASQSEYYISVKVCDDPTFFSPPSQPECVSAENILVEVTNINDSPVFVASSSPENDQKFFIKESASFGTSDTSSPSSLLSQTFDADGDVLTFSLKDSSDMFDIDVASGRLALRESKSLDFEMRKLYDVTVTVADPSGATASAPFTVRVLDANDAPVFPPGDILRSVAENSQLGALVGATIGAHDPDEGGVTNPSWFALSYALLSTGNAETDAAFEAIVPVGTKLCQIRVKAGGFLDFEAAETYSLTLRVSDAGGLHSDASIRISIKDVNESPELSAPQGVTIVIDEHSELLASIGPALSSECCLKDPDNSGGAGTQSFSFEIDTTTTQGNLIMISSQSGQLQVAGDIDFETIPLRVFSLTVTVSDNGNPVLSHTLTGLEVSVLNVNEAPELNQNQVFTLNENFAEFADEAGGFIRPNAGQIAWTDPDDVGAGPAAPPIPTFHHLDGGEITLDDETVLPCLTVTSASGKISLAPGSDSKVSTCFDFEGAAGNILRLTVKVEDSGGLFTIGVIEVSVLDVNEAPVMTEADPIQRSVSQHNLGQDPCGENCLPGKIVGSPVHASDPEEASLVYSISVNDDQDTFAVDSSTGQLSVKTVGNNLCAAAPHSFSIEVKATDPSGLFIKTSVVVTTTPENYKPQWVVDASSTPSSETIAENAPAGSIAVFSAKDGTDSVPETVKYFIADARPAIGLSAFQIDADDGTLSLLAESPESSLPVLLDFEAIAHPTLAQGVISFTIAAVDPLGETATHNFVLSVTDVNEPPAISSSSGSVDENAPPNVVAIASMSPKDADAADWDDVSGSTRLRLDIATGDDSGHFQIDAGFNLVTTSVPISFEGFSGSSLGLGLIVTDSGGLTESGIASIVVKDLNEKPLLADIGVSVSEDAAVGTLVTTLAATDPDTAHSFVYTIQNIESVPFAINRLSGTITVVSALDFEDVSDHVISVKVADGGNGVDGESSLEDTASVSIAITDVNDVARPSFNNGTDVGLQFVVPPHDTAGSGVSAGGKKWVRLFGRSGWGPTQKKIDDSGGTVATEEIAVSYGPITDPSRYSAECVFFKRERNAYVIDCEYQSGVGIDLAWTITVNPNGANPQKSDLSLERTRYAPPVLDSITGGDGGSSPSALSTEGGETITLHGRGFGPAASLSPHGQETLKVSYRFGASGPMFNPSECKIESDTRVRCKTAAGYGSNLIWRVTVAGQISNTLNVVDAGLTNDDRGQVKISYREPEIESLSAASEA